MLAPPASSISRCLPLLLAAVVSTSALPELCAGGQAETNPQTQSTVRRTQGSKTEVPDPELKAMISDVEVLLPEFKADILLSLVESGKISDPTKKKALIQKAYRAAEAVKPAYAEAPYGAVGNTPQSRKAVALSMTQLDRMSLQSRAVHDMQSLSHVKARALFEGMSFPDMPPLNCDDNWLYDPGPFYAALTEVAENDFQPDEIKSGKRLTFLAPYVVRLGSHTQVIPVAHFLAKANLNTEELRQLSQSYASALSDVPQDQHTFAVVAEDTGEYVRSVYGGDFTDTMSLLASNFQASGLSVAPFLVSLRGYIVQNSNGPRCEADSKSVPKSKGPLPEAVNSFNHAFGGLLTKNGMSPIQPSELSKSAVLPSKLWGDPNDSYDSKRLTTAIQQLNKAAGNSKNGEMTASWWRQLDDFLTQFYAWQQGDEAEADYVRERSEFYQPLLRVIPRSAQKQKVLDNYVSFLEEHSYQSLGGAEWFIHVKLLLMGMYAKDFHPEIITAFKNSRDPVLNLYARLELWQGKPDGPHWPATP